MDSLVGAGLDLAQLDLLPQAGLDDDLHVRAVVFST